MIAWRRIARVAIALLCAGWLAACGANVVIVDTSDVSSAAEDMERHVEAVQTAAAELSSHVDDFDDENWQDVVPEIRDDAATLASEVDALQSQVADLKERIQNLESEVGSVRCVSRADD